MKTFALSFILLAISLSLFAQPTTITWQGKLLDASGNAINQNDVAMTFAIFDASTGGNQLWPVSGVVTKTVNVVQGLYSVQLGTGLGDDIAFTAAMFNGKAPWLEVKVGTETLPRTEVTNVPFALISNELSASGWESPGEIGKVTPNTGKFTSLETGTLKVTDGASTGKVLTSDAGGNATWTTPYTGLTNFTESNFTFDSRPGVKFTPNNAATDVDLVLQPKRYAAIIAQQPDGTNIGGNKRGFQATDLQRFRTNASQVASGQYATIVGGTSNTASGTTSTAMGSGARATGTNSIAIGSGVTASGYIATAMGDLTTSSGRNSTTMGYYTHALSAFETVIGLNSTTYTPVSDWTWEPADRLFVVGNGYSSELRSNALTILKNANTTIGGSLTINGNRTDSSYIFPIYRGTSGQVLATDGAGNTNWSSLGNHWTSNGSNIYFNSGNVGVGTESPTQKLEVNGSTLIPSGQSYWIGNAGDTGNRLRLHQSGVNAYIDWGEEMLFFRSGATSVTTRVVIDGNGRVGIGTDQPKASLDLSNSSSNRKIALNTVADNDHQFTGFGFNGDALRYQVSGTTDSHVFYSGTSTSTSGELFRIKGNGQIVIPALTTAGVLVNSSAGLVSSSIGTTGQVLKTAADGTTSWGYAVEPGTAPGQMQYWNGTAWATVAAGTAGQILTVNSSGVPEWKSQLSIITASAFYPIMSSGGIQFKGNFNPNNLASAVYFEYGSSTSYGNTTDVTVYNPLSGNISISASVGSGINAGDACHVRLVVKTVLGTFYSNDISFKYLYIGCHYMGGYVFMMDSTGQNGKVCSDNNLSNAATWNDAVELCANYEINTIFDPEYYNDWYLPSVEELQLMYSNAQLRILANLSNGYYWSRDLHGSSESYFVSFYDGSENFAEKRIFYIVRAVRDF